MHLDEGVPGVPVPQPVRDLDLSVLDDLTVEVRMLKCHFAFPVNYQAQVLAYKSDSWVTAFSSQND
jgi:hypothetical protein